MSAILQALKRSEAERNGQSTAAVDPTMAIGPSGRGLWLWGGLLAVALLAGGWALGRLPATQRAVAAQEPTAPPVQARSGQRQLPSAAARSSAPDPAVTAEAVQGTVKPAAEPAADREVAAHPAEEPAATPISDSAPAESTPVSPLRETVDSEPPPAVVTVDLPPPEPRQAPASAGSAQPRAHEVATWMPLSAMPAGNSRDLLASMQINVHVYAAEPEARFVLVNLKRREEGDALGEGVHISEIVPEGVVVETAGMRYLWPSR